jgi:hypothetical protein
MLVNVLIKCPEVVLALVEINAWRYMYIVMGVWGLPTSDTITSMGFRLHHFRQHHNIYIYLFNILTHYNKYTKSR